ncbi:MAG TPA: rhomboid family intramembrane serine protease [Candidatus Limnocylindrales bacterium]|nr:rhomboid family intramembrane serine protease [Candidatus Limnocylindrales bacterium]
MEPTTVSIPARSRRQALDWSLVLLSQGIEHVVDRSEETSSWELRVAAEDNQNALDAIRLYQIENRHWPWRQRLSKHGVLFDWASVSWALLLCVFFWISNAQAAFESAGELDATAVAHGQWWRLFTAIWLHADLSHLASNAVFGVVFLGLTMGRYGTGVGLLAAYLAGACGNLFAWFIAPQPRFSLGASGMVMGALGLLAIQSFVLWRRSPTARKYILSGIVGGVMLFLLLGVSPGSDLLAHAGGFVSGLLVGAILTRLPNLADKTAINLLSGVGFTTLVVWPWWRALR